MKFPYTPFYWRDRMAETSLRQCSYAARGLWTELLALMGTNDGRYGFLEVNGVPLKEPKEIARLTAGDTLEVEHLLAELERAKVFSRDRNRVIYSRRMVRDAEKRALKSEIGSKGGKRLRHGLLKQLLEQLLKQKPRQNGVLDLDLDLDLWLLNRNSREGYKGRGSSKID